MGGGGFCGAMTGLVACYQFEGNTNDASGNHLDAAPVNVVYVVDQFNKAAQLANDSSMKVAGNSKFDIAMVTIEAWVKLTTLPAPTETSVVLAVNNQYVLWISDDGTVTCDLNGVARFSSTAALTRVTAGAWAHVACTYDHAVARIYLNGSAVANRDSTSNLGMGSQPMTIGSNSPNGGAPVIGLIDDVRLFSVARTAPQICSDAGQLLCP
jgi:hypothetical protein